MNNDQNGGNWIAIIVAVIFIALAFASCSGDSGSRRDVTHDPDGFLGYSDSFWEWYADNN